MPPAKKEVRPSSRGARARTPQFLKSTRGVKNWKEATAWLEWRGIEDIECITPDQAGIARGKMMPSKKFTSNTSLALPSAVFMATISGGYPEDGNGFSYPEDDGDLKLVPDLTTLTVVPWEEDPTAAVICDLVHQDGRLVEFTPRNVLRKIVSLYDAKGLRPVVAPEIEFYLVRKNPDPDYPLTPPVGRSGRAIGGGAGYSIAGVNEFDELIDDIYHFSESQGLEIDTLIHEEGAGQLANNLRHGAPVQLADQVFEALAGSGYHGEDGRGHGDAHPGRPRPGGPEARLRPDGGQLGQSPLCRHRHADQGQGRHRQGPEPRPQ